MDQNVKIGLTVDSNGTTDRETKKAHALKAAYDAAAKSAGSVGGTAGSRSAAQSAQPMAAAQVREYGQLRGTAGETGASARDFANQAQGLSGLVRLYAVYAANIFAVGAAFRALSTAMDTTNMIRGMDELGASSGMALGGLSKQLVSVTGGAISLREAMSATVKVTAAGLGSESVLRLGQVASKASQALGVDLGDAISRLSRGITKLEPELLDELGIFTKIEPAVEKYAISVGKSASQLTDFERRQAFANAVLAEGEKKFAAIQIDANPYNKLAASLANIAQKGLELVNTVLGPIVNLLSSSPTALITALVAVGGAIIKQAIPAFGLFRQNLQKASLEANEAAQVRAAQAVAIQKDLNNKLLNLVEARANKEIKILDEAEAKFEALKKQGVASRAVKKVLKTEDIQDISESQLATIDKAAANARKKGLEEQAKVYDELSSSIRRGQQAERDYIKTKADNNKALLDDINNRRTIIGLNFRLAESAEKASFKDKIVSNAAYAGSLIGPINAIKLMRAEIDASGISMSKFSLAMLLARGGLAAFAGAAAVVGTVLISAFSAITTIIGIGATLQALFTKTAKESQATSEAFGQLEESTKNLGKTIDVINKKPYLEQFNAETINARANALEAFSSSLQKTNEASQKELSTMSWLDKAADIVKILWSGDVQAKLNKETAYGISKAFEDAALSGSPAGKAAKQAIANLLKIDPDSLTSLEDINRAFIKLGKSEAPFVISQINNEFDKLTKTNRAQASSLLGIDEGFKKVTEAKQKFAQALLPTDDFTNFGRALTSVSFELEKGLKDPETRLQSIRRLFEELKNIGGINPDILLGLSDLKDTSEKLQNYGKTLEYTEANTDRLTKRQKELQTQLESLQRVAGARTKKSELRNELEDIQNQLNNLKEYKDTTINLQLNLKTSIDDSQKLINQALSQEFKIGADIVANKLNIEFAKAGQTITNALAGILTGTEAGIKLRADAEKAMLAAQLQQIKTTQEQIVATVQNTILLKELALSRKEELLRTSTSLGPDDIRVLEKEITDLKRDITSNKMVLKPGVTYNQLAQQRAKELSTGAEATVTPEALKLSEQLAASRAAIANISAQGFAVELKIQEELLKFSQQRGVADKEREIQSLKATKDLATANQVVYNQNNESALLARQQLDAQIRQKEEVLRQTDALNRLDALEFARKKVSESNIADKQEILGLLEKEVKYVREAAATSAATASAKEESQIIKDRLDLIQLQGRLKQEQLDREAISRQQTLSLQTQALDLEQKTFDILNRSIELSPDYVAQEEMLLSVKRAQLEFDKQREQLQSTRLKALAEQQTLEAAVQATAMRDSEGVFDYTQQELAELERIRQKREDINTAYQNGLGLQTTVLTLALREVAAKKAIADEQNRYNKIIEVTNNIGSSLKAVFEGLSSSADRFSQGIENVVSSLVQIGIQAEKNSKRITVLNEALNNPEISPEERVKTEKELAVATEKRTKDDLAGTTKLISSAKMLFKEKTAGYKALAALEKAMHIASLAMNAQKIISDGVAMASSISSSLASAFAAGKAAIVKAYNAPWPMGFVTGAAMAAIIGGLLGKSFGGSKGGAPAITSQQRQETQGSAMGYNEQGQLSQFRRGALGDPTAKSQLIDKSIQLLAENSVDNLQVNNKMLQALYKIEAGIRGVSAGIYNIPGLASGSAFGTKPGSSGFNLLGLLGSQKTREIIDSGLKFSGTLAQLATDSNGLVKIFETVATTTKRSFLGISRSSTRTSTETQSLGQNAQTERLAGYLERTFSGAIDFLEETSEAAGFGKAAAQAIINSFDLPEELRTFSTRGLKPEEMGQAFQAWLGGVMDFYGEKIFGNAFDEFAQGGEEITQTVARIINANEVVNQSFKNLGLEDLETGINRITGLTGVDLQVAVGRVGQELIDLAGGLENFADRANFIAENFLTEAQKQAVAQETALRGLRELGVSVQDIGSFSRQDYMNVLDQLKQASIEGRQGAADLYNSWANLAPVLDKVMPKIEEVGKTFQDTLNKELALNALGPLQKELIGITDKSREYYDELVRNNQATKQNVETLKNWESTMMSAARALRLQAQQSQYSDLFNTSKLDILTQKFRTLGFNLPSNTRQLQLLIDGIDTTTDRGIDLRGNLLDLGNEFKSFIDNINSGIRSAYDSRVQELKGAQTQFKDFAKSIKDFKTSLLTGSLSTLLPQQQYAVIKSEFQQTAQLAMQGNVEAIQKLQGLSSQFLETSRGMYASSEQYTQDFNSVLEVLDSTTTITELQVQIAENTLTEIKNVVGGIIDLSDEVNGGNVILTGLGSKLTDALQAAQSIPQTSDSFLLQQLLQQNTQNLSGYGNIVSAVGNSAESNNFQQHLNRLVIIDSVQHLINNLQPVIAAANAGNSAAAANTSPATSISDSIVYISEPPSYSGGDFSYGDASPGFAKGANYIPQDMVASIHKGERIIPAADNTQLMAKLSEPSELKEEIARLNQAIIQLQQTVAQGAVINADATNRNTEEITSTLREVNESTQYTKRVQSRTTIV